MEHRQRKPRYPVFTDNPALKELPRTFRFTPFFSSFQSELIHLGVPATREALAPQPTSSQRLPSPSSGGRAPPGGQARDPVVTARWAPCSRAQPGFLCTLLTRLSSLCVWPSLGLGLAGSEVMGWGHFLGWMGGACQSPTPREQRGGLLVHQTQARRSRLLQLNESAESGSGSPLWWWWCGV